MSSTWGEQIHISIFGGSHTEAIGVTIDGLPAGEQIDMEKVMVQMARRAPGQDPTATKRTEKDEPHVLSGMLSGVLTGAPLTAMIYNTNQRSQDYENLRIRPRPGHSDYTAHVKYGGCNDIRGGGHFSARLTAPLVFAGAVCRQILEKRGIFIGAHVASIGSVRDTPLHGVSPDTDLLRRLSEEYFPVVDQKKKEEMYEIIEGARRNLDSVGGVVECLICGMPVGVGNPMFDGVENIISSMVFGVPAVKGIEFGDGFAVAEARGSENNDAFYYEGQAVRTKTNHAGGILGGITSGMPIIFRAALKPTPSIGREQDTVNLRTGENDKLVITGRHDPCVVPRAVPVIEAAAAVAVTELLAQSRVL